MARFYNNKYKCIIVQNKVEQKAIPNISGFVCNLTPVHRTGKYFI